jgi:membrane-bound lytic murein transglycosylase A
MDADANAAQRPQSRAAATYSAVTFKDLPGWAADDQAAAFGAFLKSCERLIVLSRTDSKVKADEALIELCVKAGQLGGLRGNAEARAFFEQHFVPHRVAHEPGKGLLTAYYEPIVPGSRTPTARFSWPLYKRPADLVTIVDEANRGTVQGSLTHARQSDKGLVPFATRAEIEQGALKGKNLELMYVEHAVDAFFMQIQGSARVKLPDGSLVRVGYDGKNGHPYTSIGRVLIDQGQIPVERMSLQALQTWLKANSAKAREVMWANKSFVFFKEHAQKEASGPQGVHDITLTPGRSLAVDPSYHALGLPIFVAAPEIKHIPAAIGAKPDSPPSGSLRKSAAAARDAALTGFHRLMVAQDVGSAIKGPERGDIYVGTGDAAGKIAGTTKHTGNFFVLVPKAQSKIRQPSVAVSGAGTPPPPAPSGKPAAAPTVAAPQATKELPKVAPAATGPAAVTTQKPQQSETIVIKQAPAPEKSISAPMPADKPIASKSGDSKPASKAEKTDDDATAIADQMRTSLQ